MSTADFDLSNDSENKRYDDVFLGILQKEEKIDKFLDCVFNFLCRRTDFFLIQETPDLPYGFPPNVAKHMLHKIFTKYDSVPKEKLKQMLLDTNEPLKKSSSQVKKPEQPKADQSKSSQASIQAKSSKESSLNQLDLKTKQEIFQNDPSSYNGAKLDKYSWTQTIKEIDVRVKIGTEIKSSKDVKIKIQKEDLQVLVKTGKDDNSWETVISDKLSWKVKPEDSTWSLFPGDHIHIYLEKVQERWWERLLESEEKLDLKNMNPEKPMEELDEESQTKIKQMMYDEQQKRQGLPTSEEQKNIEMLKKAWDAEGSPFKGQPFDPSVLKMK